MDGAVGPGVNVRGGSKHAAEVTEKVGRGKNKKLAEGWVRKENGDQSTRGVG